MRMLPIALVLASIACSGGGAPPEGVQAPRPEPQQEGLGRVADVPPSGPCARERASAPLAADATPTECRTDAECTAGTNGRCVRLSSHGGHGPSLEASRCSYDACFSDADCGDARSICACSARAAGEVGEGHLCIGGECATDADCGADRYCRRSALGRYCHSTRDECTEETDCGAGRTCQRDGTAGPWRCTEFVAPVG